MGRVMFMLLVLHAVLQVAWCANSIFDAVFWQVKPYAFINDEGQVDGIYPMIFRQAQIHCTNETDMEYFNSTKLISFSFNMSSRRSFLNTYKSNYNRTRSMRPGRDVWFPLFVRSTENIRNREREKRLKNFHISTSKGLAIIVHRDHISITNKIIRGIFSCDQILLLAALLTTFFGILLWLFEGNYNPVFPKNSVRGIGVGIWWSLVSMTTVGYGDVVPKTFPGRLLATVWVCIGVMVICITTATVTEVVNGTDVHIHGQKVSVLENSFESEKLSHFGPVSVEKSTYEGVIRAVRQGEVFAAAINADIAAWMIDELQDDSHPNPLRVVKMLAVDLNLNIAMSDRISSNEKLKQIVRCMNRQHSEVYDRAISHFSRQCETQTIFIGNFWELFKTTLVQVLLGGIALFFVIGIVFNTDILHKCIPLLRSKDEVYEEGQGSDDLIILRSSFFKRKKQSDIDVVEGV